jgi:hypothetical protein
VGLLEHFKDGCMLVEPGTFSPRDFREALTALWINAPDLSQGIQSTAEQLVELNRGHYREFAAMLQE